MFGARRCHVVEFSLAMSTAASIAVATLTRSTMCFPVPEAARTVGRTSQRRALRVTAPNATAHRKRRGWHSLDRAVYPARRRGSSCRRVRCQTPGGRISRWLPERHTQGMFDRTDFYESAAHFHARSIPGPATAQVWVNHFPGPAVVLGSTQRAPSIIDADDCTRRGIDIVRRRSTGGDNHVEPGDLGGD